MGYVGRCFAIKPVQAVTLIEIERLCLTLVNSFAPFILLDFLILLWLDGDALCCWSCVACAKPLAWTVRQASRSAARGVLHCRFSLQRRAATQCDLWFYFSVDILLSSSCPIPCTMSWYTNDSNESLDSLSFFLLWFFWFCIWLIKSDMGVMHRVWSGMVGNEMDEHQRNDKTFHEHTDQPCPVHAYRVDQTYTTCLRIMVIVQYGVVVLYNRLGNSNDGYSRRSTQLARCRPMQHGPTLTTTTYHQPTPPSMVFTSSPSSEASLA